MKQDPTYFDGVEPELVYIARRLNDAVALESLFTDSGIDYGVEADEYTAGAVFRSTRIGAFFYVRPEFREAAVGVLLAHGYIPVKS